LRDFYAFEEHVATAHKKRGREVPPAWYEIPVFYFGHTGSVIGPDAPLAKPAWTEKLDFELEIACVIGKPGRDIAVADAADHIAGYTIMNDWGARDVQRQEMSVGLGPAKGKDFATSLGPYLVTPDELADRFADGRHDLTMTARINGEEVTNGNAKTIHWTFADMIARASQAVELLPGDVIGSGTVGGGCLLELGEEVHPWLTHGDEVELEIERLGRLRNRVV
jgi:fumarylacetoacetate (FAA) hydrolase